MCENIRIHYLKYLLTGQTNLPSLYNIIFYRNSRIILFFSIYYRIALIYIPWGESILFIAFLVFKNYVK